MARLATDPSKSPADVVPQEQHAPLLAKLEDPLKKVDWSASNVNPNTILRGAQLTVVGAIRALQNPQLFKHENYRQAAIAVAAGIAIRLIIAAPTLGIRVLLWIISFFVDYSRTAWDDSIVSGLEFIEKSVLQIPLFLMTLMKYLTPALDNMFMDSLAWVDSTYVTKHQSEDPTKLRGMYHRNLSMYNGTGVKAIGSKRRSPYEVAFAFGIRYARRAGISLLVYLLSFLPYVGRFVLPGASFYALNKAIGVTPAAIIFSTSVLLPRHYLVVFLQTYFSSRTLMRELLEPYFSRIHFTPEQKRRWFRDREGLLFGFGVGFYVFLRIPLLGVLMYGIAEASTAYLITKITDPPPPPDQSIGFAESQVHWRNKHEFMNLSLDNLDAHTIKSKLSAQKPLTSSFDEKKTT